MSTFVIIGIVASILLMAFYSGVEVAFASANRLNIELKKKQGTGSAILLSKLFDHPSRFIGIIIIGYNLFLVLFVLLVSTFWNLLLDSARVKSWMDENAKIPFRVILEIVLSVIAVILLGDFIPKAIFRAKSNRMLSFSARTGLLGGSDYLFWPIARMFIGISTWILDIIFNVRIDKKKEPFSRADLENNFPQAGELHHENQDLNTDLFEAALSLPKVKIRECLVPRKEIEAIEIKTLPEEVRKKMIETKLSKLVVFDKDIDHIVGYIHQLDLFKNPATVKDILLPIPAIPESMSATDLINKFTRDRKSIAWVVDEFGGTAGIVTMEDLLEEIFGEIRDEYDIEEFEEKRLSETEYIFSGRLELDYLKEKYNFEFPQNESETLSGFIIHQHETIPKLKERIIIGDYEFEVMNVSDTRIEMVKMRVLA
ncbi:MAG: HlyC/CorC family transporter [Chitinophagaceae bacterium]|nr:HlyC/CorC family transporter [Chitinophagaceae bacterium]